MVANGCMRYIQPEIPKSFKPCVAYRRSEVPLDSRTVYKTSYFAVPQCGRPALIVPHNNLLVDPSVRMDDVTVTALSYPGHKVCGRAHPILPSSHRMSGTGPMQDLTTQKHDYVAKPMAKQRACKPRHMLHFAQQPLQKTTIAQLSFPNPNIIDRVKSCKPILVYQRPCAPMNVDTTQKLSFQPVCPSVKETLPWAVREPYRQPTVPMAHDTTYHLSFMGGSGKREPLQIPRSDRHMITADSPFDGRTVYKESYLGAEKGFRPLPIYPTSQLLMAGADHVKMDTNTMYGLAYEGHFNVCKQQPIRPMEQPLANRGGVPMQDLTTQKHDFEWKQCSKRLPFKPRAHHQRPTAALATITTANASYMPITEFSPSVSCRPHAQYVRPCVLMDTDTTQKLSFQPVSLSPKEQLEWAQKPAYQKPVVPMSTETVHQLSYPAPGRYEECCVPCQPEPTTCC